MAPCTIFSLLSISVGFPALSMVQHDLNAVRQGTCKIMKAGTLLSIPVFVALGLLSYDIVRIMPTKYAGVGETLRWLSVFGASMVLLRQMTPALYAIRKVHWCAVRGLVNFVMLAVLIIPMYRRWGLAGACWATNIALVVTNVLMLVVLLRMLKWGWGQWFGDLAIVWRAWAGGGLAFGGAYLCASMAGYDWDSSVLLRCLLCGMGLLGYAIACLGDLRVSMNRPVENGTEQLAATE